MMYTTEIHTRNILSTSFNYSVLNVEVEFVVFKILSRSGVSKHKKD